MKMIVVGNRATQETFLKAQFVIFRCQKYVKKGYIEMTKKNYLETFKKCPGLLCFPLLSLKRYILWMLNNQAFCVHIVCHNNENNMSNSNTGCPILIVHMWDIMFAREEYLQRFWRSGVPTAKHPDRTHLRAFQSSVKSVN